MSEVETVLFYADFLLYVQNSINSYVLILIFGKEMGNHLIPKWNKCKDNVLLFLTQLDYHNRYELIKYMLRKYNNKELH
jgi:hypothetical protein